MLGKSVAGEVGFREEAEAGDAAGARELVPLRGADGTEFHLVDDFIEKLAQYGCVFQRLGRASECFNDPFDSAHRIHSTPLIGPIRRRSWDAFGFAHRSPLIRPGACRIPGKTCWHEGSVCRTPDRISW